MSDVQTLRPPFLNVRRGLFRSPLHYSQWRRGHENRRPHSHTSLSSLRRRRPALFQRLPYRRRRPQADAYWQVDDVRAGMKGVGRTVMHGTKVESFDAEVLGVLKNTSPGRDMVLCRLSGLGLEKTGVIAGMSGSPISIDGKLLGAVAYAWPYGKEPIAGVTPFCQMHDFVEAYERRDLAGHDKPVRVGLRRPLHLDGKSFESATVSTDVRRPGADRGGRPVADAVADAAGRVGIHAAQSRSAARKMRRGRTRTGTGRRGHGQDRRRRKGRGRWSRAARWRWR